MPAHNGFDIILPFLKPIEPLILDPNISEIMVNGSQRVFIEREGALQEVPGIDIDKKFLGVAVKQIARRLGDDISEAKPILDSRLPDGSRVAAVIPPCSVDGITLTIRKFNASSFGLSDLVRIGAITKWLSEYLVAAIEAGKNIMISGATGTGKTTILNIMAGYIPEHHRVVLIEDTAEIQISKPNLVRFEARREQDGMPAITIRDLLKATLRHRPDRIILGEIRGGEAFDLLQLLNTGHRGSICTEHANSAQDALGRFETCVLMSGVELPYQAVRSTIAGCLDLILHLDRVGPKRMVTGCIRVEGYDRAKDEFITRDLMGEPR